MAGLIRVLLVDDHPLVTDGLCTALEADPAIVVAGVARTLEAARAELERLAPEVAVIDIRLPDGSGLALVGANPSTASILLSSYGTPQYVDAALRLGASGFFLKTAPSEVLVDAVKRVAAGGTAYDPDVMRRSAGTPWHALSERQREVVRLVVAGRSNDEIGAALGLSRKTVEAHLGRLFERFGTATRTELALRAEREGWLDVPPRPR
jgi:DNA-binding NarL/FixJ family response regulator